MRRALLLGAALTLIGTAGVLATLALAPRGTPRAAERVEALSAEMRCPDCQALSVAESHTQAAAAIHDEIERQVAAGRDDDEIRAYFVASYGEWILLAPPEPLVWWLPAAALLVGIGMLVAWFRFGARPGGSAEAAPVPAVSDAERQRIREELEALDG